MFTTLIDCETLLQHLADSSWIVLDARVNLADRAAGEAMYRQGHVHGARYANLERDLSDMRVQGEGRHPWPRDDDFARTLGAWSITPGTQVVVYDADQGMFAARAWWLLRTLGHQGVAVLDGGFARWNALGCPVTTELPEIRAAAAYPATFDRSLLFSHDDVIAHLAHGGLLVDARAAERFRGDVEPLDRKAGHVPGAVNRPFARNLAGDGRFKSPQELFAEFGELLSGRTPSDLVSMCGSGVTAAHNLLAMAHAGLIGAKLYTGSWSGWISDDARPVATGDA